MKNKKVYFGIVLAGILLNIISQGIGNNIIGLFFPTMTQELNQSQTAVSAIASFILIGGMLTAVYFSRLYQKYSTRKVVLISGLLAAFCYMAVSFTESMPIIYGLAFFMGVFGLGASGLSAPMLITRWFDDKRGTAMGIALAGAGIGPALITPLILSSINSGGYKKGFITLGIIVAIIIIVSFLLIKDNPQKEGLEPYRDGSGDKKVIKKEVYSYTLKEAMKTKMFYTFTIFCFVECIVMVGICIQLPSYFTSIGFGVKDVALILSVYGLFVGVGKILTGYLYDRIGYYKSNIIFFSAIIAAFVCLLIAADYSLAVYGFILFAGFGFGIGNVAVPLFVSLMFGNKHYPQIYMVFSILICLGAIIGAIVSGLIIDFANYNVLIWYSIIMMIVLYCLAQKSMKLSEKDQKERIENQC